MRKLMFTVIVLAGLTGLTVAAAQRNPSEPPQNMSQMGMMMAMKDCPIAMTDANIVVADTQGGISLTLTPKDPAKLDEFRAQVRERVERFKKMREAMKMQNH
jgi:hypothetical protein